MTGGPISEDWVAAKISGRWRDGSPLVGHMNGPADLGPGDSPPNDFAYGSDDPGGLACPSAPRYAEPIRAKNQEPGDPDEQRITNRHRLLRRGRSCAYQADGEGAGLRSGLLFMVLRSDIERQFEYYLLRSLRSMQSQSGYVDSSSR